MMQVMPENNFYQIFFDLTQAQLCQNEMSGEAKKGDYLAGFYCPQLAEVSREA